MIVRVSQAHVRPGLAAAFLERLERLVATFPDRYDGLLRHEVLVDLDDPHVVQYVSWWRDEDALVSYAGPGWRSDPVTFPDEDAYLVEPLTLRHFTRTWPDADPGPRPPA